MYNFFLNLKLFSEVIKNANFITAFTFLYKHVLLKWTLIFSIPAVYAAYHFMVYLYNHCILAEFETILYSSICYTEHMVLNCMEKLLALDWDAFSSCVYEKACRYAPDCPAKYVEGNN